MAKRAAEREQEMARIWGDTSRKKQEKFDRDKAAAIELNRLGGAAANAQSLLAARPPRDDDEESNISFVSDTAGLDNEGRKKGAAAAGKKKSHKVDTKYRLHTFVEPGTSKNDVREVFEGYGDPDVDLRTSQKGNMLNKTHFAVLTFKNKALALWATKHLDGTNQRDTLGCNPMVLGMFLSREQQKLVTRRRNKLAKKETTTKKKK